MTIVFVILPSGKGSLQFYFLIKKYFRNLAAGKAT